VYLLNEKHSVGEYFITYPMVQAFSMILEPFSITATLVITEEEGSQDPIYC
jgi:hypothetical protein